jgi:DNA-binding LacI/PurR family transcriptional regulator
MGVLQAARALKLQVPTDLSLIGFDNSILARISDPQLTTIAQPIEEMGAKVIELLVNEITNTHEKNKVMQRVTLSPLLIIRESTSTIS